MKNRNGAKVDVEGVPHVAHVVAEDPLPAQDDARVEPHGHDGDEHVRQREADDEVVRYYSQLPEPTDADYDEQVPEDGSEDDEAHDECLEREGQSRVCGRR